MQDGIIIASHHGERTKSSKAAIQTGRKLRVSLPRISVDDAPANASSWAEAEGDFIPALLPQKRLVHAGGEGPDCVCSATKTLFR